MSCSTIDSLYFREFKSVHTLNHIPKNPILLRFMWIYKSLTLDILYESKNIQGEILKV